MNHDGVSVPFFIRIFSLYRIISIKYCFSFFFRRFNKIPVISVLLFFSFFQRCVFSRLYRKNPSIPIDRERIFSLHQREGRKTVEKIEIIKSIKKESDFLENGSNFYYFLLIFGGMMGWP